MADGRIVIDTALNSDGIKRGIGGLKNIATAGLKATGAAIGGVSTGLLALGGYAVKVGASFEQGMSEVSAISGAAGTDLESLTEKAKEMGRKTKFSATESAEAMKYMAMAGWKTTDMLNGVEGIMNLAAASGEDLATTSDIVTDALTAFGLSANNSTRFADILAAASSNANTNVAMLGESFKYVAPVAGALGYSAEDCSVALGLMANSGIKAGQAGTSLRALLANLSKPTDQVKSAMSDLGISLTDSSGKMKSMDTLMGEMRTSFSGLSEEQKAQYAATLAGQEGMSGLLAIVNASDKDFNKLKDSIYNCDGAAAQMAATMQDNLAGQLTILKSSAEGLGIEIYESIQEPLKDLAQVGINAVNRLTESFKAGGVEGLLEAGASIVVNLLEGMARGFPKLLTLAMQVIYQFVTCLNQTLPNLIAAGGTIMTTLIDGIAKLIPSLTSLGFNLIVQLGQALISQAPQLLTAGACIIQVFYNRINTLIPELVSIGMDIVSTIASGLSTAMPSIAQSGLKLFQNLAQSVISGIPQLVEIGQSFVGGLLNALISAGPLMITAGVQIITALIDGVSSALPSLIPLALSAVLSLASGIVANLPSIINAGINLLLGLAQGIANAIPVLIAQVPQIINSFFSALDMGIMKLLVAGVKIILILAKGIIQAIPALIANLPQVLLAIYNVFAHINLLSAGKQAIKSLATGIKNAATTLPATAKACATKIWNAIINKNWLSLGKNLLLKVINGIKGMFGAASGAGASAANGVKNAISKINWASVGKALLTKVVNGIKGMLSAAVSAAAKIGTGIKTKFTSINWGSVGSNIIKGIKSGIAGMAGSLMEAARGVAKRCLDAAKSALGIHSPSTKFRDIVGKNILRGIVAGIKAEQKNVQKTVKSLCSSLVNASKKANGNYKAIGSDYVKKLTSGINSKANESIKSVKNLVNKNITALAKSNKKAKSEYSKAGKAVVDAYTAAVKEKSAALVKQVEDALTKASEAAQAKYDEIVKKQQEMQEKIADYGDVYTEGRGLFLVGDLQKNVDDIRIYQQNLMRLKGKIPETMMQEILGMDIGNANKYVAALDNLTEDAYNKYISLWNEKQALSETISSQYYKSDLNAVKTAYEAEVAQIAKSAKESTTNIGVGISESFSKALAKESKNMSKTAKKVTDSIAKSMKKNMTAVGTQVANGLISGVKSQSKAITNTIASVFEKSVKTAKKTLKINSPSKVFEGIGRFSIKGAEKGTEEEGKNLIRQSGGLAERFSDQFNKAKFNVGSMVEKMKRAVMAERSNMTLAVTGGAAYNMSNTTQIDWSNAPAPQFNGTIQTHVNLDSREVGTAVTPVVSENMAFRKGRLR